MKKLLSGLSFINVLRTAFTLKDPKSVKKTVKLSIFFTYLGSMSVKAVRRMLMKLSPDNLLSFRQLENGLRLYKIYNEAPTSQGLPNLRP
jgi:hypothetical protein